MIDSDEVRHEIERLVKLGRERLGPPSQRQILVARTIDPYAWSDNAEEHVSYCRRHGLLGSETHFGTQYVMRRRLALLRAAEVLKALDRQASDLHYLKPLDARAISERLRKKAFDLHRAALPQGLHTKAAGAVFFLNGCDGVPAPHETMHEDGRVSLTWSERGRTARLDVDVNGAMTMTLEPAVGAPFAMDFQSWNSNSDAMLASVTDWVHHDGPAPYIADQVASAF